MSWRVPRGWLAGPLYSVLVAPLVATFAIGLVVGTGAVVDAAREGSVGDLVFAIHMPLFFSLVAYLPALYFVGPQALLAGVVGTLCLTRWKGRSNAWRRIRALPIGAALGVLAAATMGWRDGVWLTDPVALCLGGLTGGFVSLHVSKLVGEPESS